jgi:uncharacterized protein (UPF0147 family)
MAESYQPPTLTPLGKAADVLSRAEQLAADATLPASVRLAAEQFAAELRKLIRQGSGPAVR